MKLVLTSPASPERHVWPIEETPVRIGRGGASRVRIRDRSISREHAEIVLREGRLYLTDLHSHNGTWLNGARVRRAAELHEGDRIHLGRIELSVAPDAPDPLWSDDAGSALTTLAALPPAAVSGRSAPDDRRSRDLVRRLETFGRVLVKHQTLHGTLESLLCAVEEALPAQRLLFLMRRQPEANPEIVAARPRIPCMSERPVVSLETLREVMERGTPLLVPDAGGPPGSGVRRLGGREVSTALAVPLADDRQTIGVLYAEHPQLEHGYGKEHVEVATLFANMATVRIVNERMTAIEKRGAELEQELVTAGQIQRWLLPAHETRIAGYDIHALLEPCEAVGGDFYDFHSDPEGNFWILLGDVAGKGIPGAILMSTVLSSARVLYDDCAGPVALAERLNAVLRGQAECGRFVTAFIGRLDPDRGVLDYVNAGHTSPLLAVGSRLRVLDRTGQALGVTPDYEYSMETVALGPGAMLAVFTDGIPEARRERGRFFGARRVAASIRAAARCDRLDEAGRTIIRCVNEFLAGCPRTDDIALLLLRRHS